MWDQVLCLLLSLLGPPPLTQSGDVVLKIGSHLREIQEDVCIREWGGEKDRREMTREEAGESRERERTRRGTQGGWEKNGKRRIIEQGRKEG